MRAKDKKALKKLFKENAPLAITKVAVDYTAINLIHFSSSILWTVHQVADANDPVALRKRGTLNLPAPQVCADFVSSCLLNIEFI